jgi:catechol 2,3-dioxygenase-like lactoylglutathione lyase family enzyme
MPNPSTRRIDHLVLPSSDLEAQADFYRRLGFQVGARNIHPWGTENRLVQFDGCFLELITLGEGAVPPAPSPRRFSFGAHVGEWMERRRDGMSMLAVSGDDAEADARWFDQAGIAEFEPFHFGRKGKRPDGSEIELAFTLAFSTPAVAPDLCFFVCQHHFPHNFWNKAFQRHGNTALGISSVLLLHNELNGAAGFLRSFVGGIPSFGPGKIDLQTAGGALVVSTPEAASFDFGSDPILGAGGRARFAAAVFTVESLDAAELSLRTGNVPYRRHRHRLIVPSAAAFGVLLAFEEAREGA